MQWGRWTNWRISEILPVCSFIMTKKYSLKALNEIFKSCVWVVYILISTILNCFEKYFCTLERTNENITENICTTFFNIFVIFILNFLFMFPFESMVFFCHCYPTMNFNFLILCLTLQTKYLNKLKV